MKAQMKAIFGIVNTGSSKKGFWTQIGVAFVNSDGSLNLKFNYLPADLATTTIQVRDQEQRAAAPIVDTVETIA